MFFFQLSTGENQQIRRAKNFTYPFSIFYVMCKEQENLFATNDILYTF